MPSNPLDSDQLEGTSYSPLRQLNYQPQASLLVVEDNNNIWFIIQHVLSKTFTDVIVHRTSNHQETIRYLQEKDPVSLPKLILQDLYIPRKEDGLDLLKDTRRLLANQQHIPIVVISSSTDPVDVKEVYQCQGSYYIVKPVDFSGWLNLVRSIRQFWWDQGVLPIYGSVPKGE